MLETTIISNNSNNIPIYKNKEMLKNGYSLIGNSKTNTSEDYLSVQKVLVPEFDIFPFILEIGTRNNHVDKFIKAMRKSIQEYNPDDLYGIAFPKLQASENTDSSVVIEWIFNYFRFCFSFDDLEGDYYGLIIYNELDGSFHNDFIKMSENDYPSVADWVIAKAICLLEGRK